jgi:two-component system NtrC family response regulator
MSKDFLDHLQQHEWKGNIRELKNIIERAVILSDGPQLTVDNLPSELQVDGTPCGRAVVGVRSGQR